MQREISVSSCFCTFNNHPRAIHGEKQAILQEFIQHIKVLTPGKLQRAIRPHMRTAYSFIHTRMRVKSKDCDLLNSLFLAALCACAWSSLVVQIHATCSYKYAQQEKCKVIPQHSKDVVST